MKIPSAYLNNVYNSGVKGTAGGKGRRAGAVEKGAQSAKNTAPKQDQIMFSSGGSELRDIGKIVSQVSGEARAEMAGDAAKVERIGAAVRNGEYNLDPAAIADAMLRSSFLRGE